MNQNKTKSLTPRTDTAIENMIREGWDDLSELCRELEMECDSRKAAHDNQVELKRIISDRPDLKERAKLVAELIEERDSWREAAYALAEALPPSWEELQPPAAQLAKFKEMVALQNEKTKNMRTTKVEAFVPTIIEYRDKNGKLCEGYFDETLPYIQRTVLNWVDNGFTEFKVIENNRNYDFYWLSDYE